MKRLYRVQVEAEVFVVAEDDYRAELQAASQFLSEVDVQAFASEVRSLEHVPQEWRTSRPFGEDDDEHTVEWWVGQEAARPLTEAELERSGQGGLLS